MPYRSRMPCIVLDPHVVTLADGHVVSDARARLDMPWVVAAVAGSYWAAGRAAGLTERSWDNCLGIGAYAPDGRQVGCARVLTDYALRAHIGDVFVAPAARGCGLGVALVAYVLAHPALASVDHWTLNTADAQALYARFGFRAAEPDGRAMALDRSAGRPG